MRRRLSGTFVAAIALGLLFVGTFSGFSERTGEATTSTFEVWGFDQANTVAGGGGQLFIWDGRDAERNARRAQAEVIDLAAAAVEADCPIAVRPHMGLPNHTDPPSHVILANVGSGDIQFIDVETRSIDGCVGGLGQAHAAVATTDNSMVIVADIAGERLHKISTDYATASYAHVETLFLGTDEVLSELGTEHARPVCHDFARDTGLAYVTLAGGGLLVVDPGSADGGISMEIVHVYPAAMVPGLGCGAFPLDDGRMITNGESGQFGGDDFLFIFEPPSNGSFPDPITVELPGDDTHGVSFCEAPNGDLFAWTVMRVSNHINIVDLQDYEVVRTWNMARGFSPDPKPDLAVAQNGSLFVSLRGPVPLTAIPALTNPERTPGVAVLTMHRDCLTFNWGAKDIAPMLNPTMTVIDGVEVTTSDPHGLAVVPRE